MHAVGLHCCTACGQAFVSLGDPEPRDFGSSVAGLGGFFSQDEPALQGYSAEQMTRSFYVGRKGLEFEGPEEP